MIAYIDVKRAADVVGSIFLLFLLFPLFLVTAVAILVSMGLPVFFLQERIGKNERSFKIIKFRTMQEPSDQKGGRSDDEYRTTKLGKMLRATSIDELPELFNVLLGDMSIIGPRPLLPEYLPFYSTEQKRRHLVRPGITGMAQVNGRNLISWEEKFEFDCLYVDNLTVSLDLKILFQTVIQVLKKSGINDASGRPVDRFRGTRN